jgi:hypothetical protein
MKTDELIAALAQDAAPVAPGRAERRFLVWLAFGPLCALALMLLVLHPRADIGVAVTWPMFWFKVLWPAVVAAVACALLLRLGHPGLRMGRRPLAAFAPLALVTVVGLLALAQAAPAERLPLLLGATWFECPELIAMLSIPAFVLAFAALRGLAPTRLRLAGAVAGLFAGAAGAFGYAFHCPELQLPFLGVWYVLGMLVPVAFGAWLGPRLLRW